MENYIIIAIVLLVGAVGVYNAIKHFKGKSGCCGGSDYKPKKKKIKNVIYEKTFVVDGMRCDHCKNRVEEIVNGFSGVAARVNLKNGELKILYSEQIDDEVIVSRIEKAGYHIKDIKE